MGVVEEVGADVTHIKPGDCVVVPFNISCGRCWMCRRGFFAQCETAQVTEQGKGAALFGYTSLYGSVPGGQAQYLRVPQAHFGPIKVPDEYPDERFLFLSDILPTAWQAVKYADTSEGSTCAVIGLGPLGQLCARVAKYLGAEKVTGVSRVPERLDMARRYGIDVLDGSRVNDVPAAITRPGRARLTAMIQTDFGNRLASGRVVALLARPVLCQGVHGGSEEARHAFGRGHDPRCERWLLTGPHQKFCQNPVAASGAVPVGFVAVRCTAAHVSDQGLGAGEGQGDAFAGERVDVSGSVADEQNPPVASGECLLAERARASYRGGGRFRRESGCQLGEALQLGGEGGALAGEQGDADEFGAERGDVRLPVRCPVHLDVRGPWGHRVVTAQPVPGHRTVPYL